MGLKHNGGHATPSPHPPPGQVPALAPMQDACWDSLQQRTHYDSNNKAHTGTLAGTLGVAVVGGGWEGTRVPPQLCAVFGLNACPEDLHDSLVGSQGGRRSTTFHPWRMVTTASPQPRLRTLGHPFFSQQPLAQARYWSLGTRM